jgi:tetratricopeptide (TPR) repeat protein
MFSRNQSNNCTYRWRTLGTNFADRIVVNFGFSHFKSSLVLAAVFLLMPVAVAAQGGALSGNVVLPNGAYLNERAKITLQTSRGVRSNVYTDNQGHFQFNGLSPAIYEIVVEPDGDRFEIAKVRIEVFAGMPAIVQISLKEKKSSEPNGSATAVSTGELDPAIPSQAKKEFERASDASRSGKTEDAIGHLRKAIALYPSYLMAHNDLGTQLLAQGKLDEAAAEFRRAIQIDSKAFNPCLNLGIVLVQQQQFAEAADTLKTALALRPNSPAAILYHGLALEGTNDLNGAERELKTAHDLGGSAYAVALFHLGQIYLNNAERERARQAFEGYLREAPSGPNAAQARKMLAILR